MFLLWLLLLLMMMMLLMLLLLLLLLKFLMLLIGLSEKISLALKLDELYYQFPAFKGSILTFCATRQNYLGTKIFLINLKSTEKRKLGTDSSPISTMIDLNVSLLLQIFVNVAQ